MTTDERFENLVVTVENIAGMVKDLAEQADADRETMKQAIDEMRGGVSAMLGIGEQMKQLAIGLTLAQQGTSQRVTHLERRVDVLENPTT